MKTKIIVLIVSLMFAYSCKKNEVTSEIKKTDEVKVEQKVKITEEDLKKVEVKEVKKEEVKVVKKEEVKVEVKITADDYVKFLATLNEKDIKSISKAVDYFNEKLKGIDVKIIDECYIKLDEFHNNVASNVDQKFTNKKEEEHYILFSIMYPNNENPEAKPTQSQKDYVELLKNNGLKIGTAEGTFFIVKDASFIFKKINDIVSPVMKEYLDQKQKESKEGYASDGGLSINPKDIAERIVFWENFVKKNPDFVFTKEQKDSITYMTLDLLSGMDNTPVFDYETNKLTDSFKEGYKFVIEKHSDTDLGKIIKEYYAILEKDGFKDSKTGLAFISKLTPKGE